LKLGNFMPNCYADLGALDVFAGLALATSGGSAD
jgi:hypothetical protein